MDKEALLHIGNELKAARIQKNLSLADVASQTKISQGYLSAIEEADVKALKFDIYTMGYIKNYAKLLELNAYDLLAPIKNQASSNISQITSEHLITGKEFLPSKLIISASLALLMLLYILVEYIT